MAVRNCRDVGENLQKIMSRLMANDRLVNLLYYTGKDPYNETPLTQDEKKKLVYEKLIKVVPRVGPKETAASVLVLRVPRARTNMANEEFKDLVIEIEVFVPLTQWMIKDSNLRPFAIMGEIQESLNGKTINGLGKLVGGDFDLNFLSDEISCYIQTFSLTSYE
jgi:hypothetical protein